jgi:hypothetical protein
MNEGQFIALRALGQETNTLLRELLKEQQRMNELLAQANPPGEPATFTVTDGTKLDVPAEAVGPITVETVEVMLKNVQQMTVAERDAAVEAWGDAVKKGNAKTTVAPRVEAKKGK